MSDSEEPIETRPQTPPETRPQTPLTGERGAVQDLVINAGGSAIGTGLGTYAAGRLKPNAERPSVPPTPDKPSPPPATIDADWDWPKR
jgi:hypothetical protein